jgi:hypothetical protein
VQHSRRDRRVPRRRGGRLHAACAMVGHGIYKVELESKSASGAVQATNSNGKFHKPLEYPDPARWSSVRLRSLRLRSLQRTRRRAAACDAGQSRCREARACGATRPARGHAARRRIVVIRPEIGAASPNSASTRPGREEGRAARHARRVGSARAAASSQARQLDAQRLERAEDLRKKNLHQRTGARRSALRKPLARPGEPAGSPGEARQGEIPRAVIPRCAGFDR